MQDAFEEPEEGLRCLQHHVLDLGHELDLAQALQLHDLQAPVPLDVVRVVRVLKHLLELLKVRRRLQLQVVRVRQETLAQRTTNSLRVPVVNAETHHF